MLHFAHSSAKINWYNIHISKMFYLFCLLEIKDFVLFRLFLVLSTFRRLMKNVYLLCYSWHSFIMLKAKKCTLCYVAMHASTPCAGEGKGSKHAVVRRKEKQTNRFTADSTCCLLSFLIMIIKDVALMMLTRRFSICSHGILCWSDHGNNF